MASRKLRIAPGRMRDMQASSDRTRAPGAGRAEFRIAARCGAGSNSGLESLERSRRGLVRSFNLEFEMEDSWRLRRGVRYPDRRPRRAIVAVYVQPCRSRVPRRQRNFGATSRIISSTAPIAYSRTFGAICGRSEFTRFSRE